MSPYEIGVLLHYYGSPEDPCEDKFNMRSVLWRETIDAFIQNNLIETDISENTRTYKLTERGEVYVKDGLLMVPLPVQSWHMPKILPTEG